VVYYASNTETNTNHIYTIHTKEICTNRIDRDEAYTYWCLSVRVCSVHVSCVARLRAFTEPCQSSVRSIQSCSVLPEWSPQTDWRGTFRYSDEL